MKKIISVLFILIFVGNLFYPSIALAQQEQNDHTNVVDIQSPSAVLIEGSTGTILFEKDKDKQRMPASITKIMTLLLTFEALDSGKITLQDSVSVSEYAASMGGSQVYLEPYEVQTVDTMIKCISIASANDASVAMAEHIAGSEEAFVAKMNDRAKELGMKNTHFLNCCGLDDDITQGHYSTAYDIALMSKELITKYPQISTYSTVWMDTFVHVTKKGEKEFGLTNTNKLIRTYNGITGLKTGSTSKAKYCLSATAKRDGMDLIAVVMAAPTPKDRFSDAAKLLDYGFANCSLYSDDHKDMIFAPVRVKKGVKDKIEGEAKEKFSYICVKGVDPASITRTVRMTEQIEAPITAGDKIGEIVYSINEKEIGTIPIMAKESIEKAAYKDYFYKICNHFFLNYTKEKVDLK